jgi:uncharacterized glyoxalase superfamily protein PhnB
MDVYPSLTYRDLDAALAFLESAFGLEPVVFEKDEDGAPRHAAVRWADGMAFVQTDRPDDLHGSHLGQGWVYVVVDDPDAHYERARAAGSVELLGEPHDAFDGEQRGYSARDPEGNLWTFGIHRP